MRQHVVFNVIYHTALYCYCKTTIHYCAEKYKRKCVKTRFSRVFTVFMQYLIQMSCNVYFDAIKELQHVTYFFLFISGTMTLIKMGVIPNIFPDALKFRYVSFFKITTVKIDYLIRFSNLCKSSFVINF